MGMEQRKYILIAVMISSFITPFLASSINVAIPAMAVDFQVEPTQLSWVVTAFLLGAACVLIPFGRLGDILGRRKLFRIGIVCVLLTTAGAGMAPDARILVLLRFLQGISIAMIFSTSAAVLVAAYPLSERGKVMGYTSAAVYSGLSLGPFLGGIITQPSKVAAVKNNGWFDDYIDRIWAATFNAKADAAMSTAEANGKTEGMLKILQVCADVTGYDWQAPEA